LLQRRSRLEIAVTFLAVLELLKRRRIEVMQEQLFGEIVIQRGAEAADGTPILMEDAEFGEEEDEDEP
jgi:chromatin segregation and condensation protein Rec8/ScpA/Scc1 (kleisin family)